MQSSAVLTFSDIAIPETGFDQLAQHHRTYKRSNRHKLSIAEAKPGESLFGKWTRGHVFLQLLAT